MLIIFSGLPGVGKTSIAKWLSKKISTVYLRVDMIEQCLIESKLVEKKDLRDYGYSIGYSIAKENLENGLTAIADSVNSITLTRDAWRKVAIEVNSPYIEIELICSDVNEHKKRIECRKSDIHNLVLPTWKDAQNLIYEKWNRVHLVIDTFKISIEDAVEIILRKIAEVKNDRN